MNGDRDPRESRKYRIVLIALAFFLLADIGAVVRVWVPKLDVETLLQVAIGVSALAAAYAGANAWSKQAESRVEVKRLETEAGGLEPEV